MRRRIIELLLVLAILGIIAILGVTMLQQRSSNIQPQKEVELELSQSESHYLSEHREVSIYVEPQLRYLIGNDEGGYLQEYMRTVLSPSGLTPVFVTDRAAGADARLQVVTPALRDDHEGYQFTSPLFQMEGSLFIRNGALPAERMKIYVMEDRISAKRLGRIRWRDVPVTPAFADSAEDLIELAQRDETCGILGDRSTVMYHLQRQALSSDFAPQEKEFYSCNVCLLVKESNTVVYQILNQCIHDADRHNISYDASLRWLSGEGPIYMKSEKDQSFVPVLIILMAVLIAFMIYYVTNRNMYRELDARLEQIRSSRKELQTTFHGVGHYLAELTLEGSIIDLNRAFSEYAGIGALYQKIWDAIEFSEEDREKIKQVAQDAAAGIHRERVELTVGRQIFVIDVFPIEDARGKTEKLLFMAIDVTQERMAKRQMLQDNKMIAIGQLAAGVAHEIRNPLGIIRNYCYVLKNMDDEELQAKAVEEIEKAVDKSGGIINNLLDFSRVSPGREEYIDVEEHIRNLLSLNESALRKKSIVSQVICSQPVATYMAMEPFDMILVNLITNATDAMSEGDHLTITVHKGRYEFEVYVSDTGEGIDEDMLDEIFNPFFTTKGTLGTGLGLFIVYNEIEKLNGDITVTSRKGEGTTFCVTLPIRSVPASKEEDNG